MVEQFPKNSLTAGPTFPSQASEISTKTAQGWPARYSLVTHPTSRAVNGQVARVFLAEFFGTSSGRLEPPIISGVIEAQFVQKKIGPISYSTKNCGWLDTRVEICCKFSSRARVRTSARLVAPACPPEIHGEIGHAFVSKKFPAGRPAVLQVRSSTDLFRFRGPSSDHRQPRLWQDCRRPRQSLAPVLEVGNFQPLMGNAGADEFGPLQSHLLTNP